MVEEAKKENGFAVEVGPIEEGVHIFNSEEVSHVRQPEEVVRKEALHLLQGVLAQELLAESVALVPVHNSQSRDKEVAANLGQEGDAVVGCHLQLLLQYALLGGGGASVGQLHDGGDHVGAVGEAVVGLLWHHIPEVGGERRHDNSVDTEHCAILRLQGPVRELVGLLQLVQLERLHALHRLLTVAHCIPGHHHGQVIEAKIVKATHIYMLKVIYLSLDVEPEVVMSFLQRAT